LGWGFGMNPLFQEEHSGFVKRFIADINLLVAEIKPTPKPAKKRPARKRGILVAAVCRMTPKINTIVETMRPKRRPIASATGAAVRAPKKVPADKMETMVADCEAVTSK
jgi:hypothetical protein